MIRLIKWNDDGSISLTECHPPVPPYAILSHTWGNPNEEVTYQDIIQGTASRKKEYRKIEFCRKQAASDSLQYFWVDTCCIEKSNSTELQEAINSMFRWYREAACCYVYMPDISRASDQSLVPWESQFCKSKWFTRGWTLQELLAPASVRFFSVEGDFLGDKTSLEKQIHNITQIDIRALRGKPLSQFSVPERITWSNGRQTTKDEDTAYCLLGIFEVFIPLIYGEGKTHAMERLREAVDKRKDISPSLFRGGSGNAFIRLQKEISDRSNSTKQLPATSNKTSKTKHKWVICYNCDEHRHYANESRCFKCGGDYHYADNDPCYNCGGWDHSAQDCM